MRIRALFALLVVALATAAAAFGPGVLGGPTRASAEDERWIACEQNDWATCFGIGNSHTLAM